MEQPAQREPTGGPGNSPARALSGQPDRRWWTLGIVGTGTFMSALDSSIVNIALPAIGRGTGAPLALLEWVVLAYLLTVGALLLVFGRLGDMGSRRGIYLGGQALFTVGSLLCGLSGRIGLLIAARAVQGLGAAMMLALGPALLIGAFPPSERGRALGLQATMTYLGMSLGPVLGGYLTQHLGWPAIFLVNVPIGGALVAVTARALPREAPGPRQPFDLAGAALLAGSLSAFLLAMSRGHADGWGDPRVIALLAGSTVGWGAFLLVERRVASPTLDLSLFSSWTFAASTAAAFLCYTCAAGLSFLLPFLLVRGCGFPESTAGLVLMATPVAMTVVTAPSGHLSDRVGVRGPATAGMVLVAAGALLQARLGPGVHPAAFVPGALAVGVGMGLFTAPNNSAIMSAAPGARRGVAGAILGAARTTGFASGTALIAAIYAMRLHALAGQAPDEAVAGAVRGGLVVIAGICLVAAALSALRDA